MSFSFNPTVNDDPFQARKIKLAEAMMQQGTSTAPVRTPLEGFGRLAQALAGAYATKSAQADWEAQGVKDSAATQSFFDTLSDPAKKPADAIAAYKTAGGSRRGESVLSQMAVQEQFAERKGTADLARKSAEKKKLTDQLIEGINSHPTWSLEQKRMYGQAAMAAPDKFAEKWFGEEFRAPQKPGEFDSKLQAMGLKPGTPEYQAMARKIAKVDEGSGEGGGPFKGTGMDQQTMNILLRGDPKSPDYAAAWAHYSQPKTYLDPESGKLTAVRPDMSSFRRPAGLAAPPMPQQAQAAPVAADGASPAAPQPSAQPAQSIPGVEVSSAQVTSPRPKEVPASMLDNVRKAQTLMRKIETALPGLEANPQSVGPGRGIVNQLPMGDAINNWFDAKGAMTRAGVSDVGSYELLLRSGAAVTVSEYPRAKPYIPQIGDFPPVVKDKLERLYALQQEELNAIASDYPAAAGFRQMNSLGGKTPAAPAAPANRLKQKYGLE